MAFFREEEDTEVLRRPGETTAEMARRVSLRARLALIRQRIKNLHGLK